jgi:flavin reductase (DIM6/NTAB) family NADH-FMN oxidoreductase RutF
MKKIDYDSLLPAAISQIKTGAFLMTKAGDDVNVMTIGWAGLGFFWGKPVMTIAVRPTRYTFEIIERAKDYSVSIPSGSMAKQIELCGSHSGRSCDKFKLCDLSTFPAVWATSPILAISGVHIECKIVLKSPIDPKMLADEYNQIYPKKDFHTLYFGEIMECYQTGSESP